MTASETCPTDAVLADLVAGRLEPRLADQHTKHIDHCDRCQQRLSSQANLPNIEAQLPRMNPLPRTNTGKRDSSHLEEVIKRAKEMRNSPPPQPPDKIREVDSLDAEATAAFTSDGFDLLGVIGHGGMGIVYLARERSLDRQVAVKVLSPLLASDESARKRFLREARSAAAVVHPNVITIHAVSDKPPLPYLVMEYIEGVSLQQQLDHGGAISIDNVTRIGRQLCAALAAAHAKGVVHRDIKPGNILLNKATGRVMLGDFGLARAAQNSKLTRSGMIVGTPAFVAPETLGANDTADHRSDLFSLGVVLYALCVGDSPFQSDSIMGTLHSVSSVDPEKLSDCAAHVPEWLSDVVMRLLEKDPNDRYQNATEVREAICSIPSGAKAAKNSQGAGTDQHRSDPSSLTIRTEDSSPRHNGTRRGEFNRQPMGIAAVILGALVVALGIYVVVTNREQPEVTATESISSSDPKVVTSINEPSTESGQSIVEPIEQAVAFVLLDEAHNEVERFESLDDAIEDATPGATIQIWSNETFECEDSIELHDISIVAGEGYSPVFRFRPEADEDADEEDSEAMLRVEGDVLLAGFDLQLAEGEQDAYALIEVGEDGALQLSQCDLLVEDAGYCVASEPSATISIDRCRLHTPHSIAIGLCEDDGGSLTVRQSWVTGEIAFEGIDFVYRKVSLDDCKLVCRVLFQIESAPLQEQMEPWNIKIDNTILYALESLVEAEFSMSNQSSVAESINIVGENNTFSGRLFPLNEEREQILWREQLAKQKSKHINNPFDMSEEAIEELIHKTAYPELRVKSVQEDDQAGLR